MMPGERHGTGRPAQTRLRQVALDCLLIACVWLVIYAYGVGRLHLRHEEPRRALAAREMLETGHWLVPHLIGEPYLRKPPALAWQIAVIGAVTGQVSEVVARLPSVLSVLGVALLLYWMGSACVTRRAGVLAGLMVLTSGLFLEKGPLAEIDVNLTLWVVASLWFLFRAFRDLRRFDWTLCYLFLAIAALTKGPPAMLFFVSGLAAAVTIRRDVAPLRTKRHAFGFLAFLVPVGLWLWAVHLEVGIRELVSIVQSELLERVSGGSILAPAELLFYPSRLLASFLPWTPILGLSVLLFSRSHTSERTCLARFSLITAMIATALFTMSAGKGARYLLPILPLLALATGDYLDRFLAGALPVRETKASRVCLGVATIFAGVVAAGIGPVAALDWDTPTAPAIILSATGLLAAAVGVLALARRHHVAALTTIVVSACLFRVAQVRYYVPFTNVRRALPTVLRPLNEGTADGGPVYTVSWEDFVIFYYMHTPVRRVRSLDELAARALEDGRVHCFATAAERDQLQEAQPGTWSVTAPFTWQGAEVFLLSTAADDVGTPTDGL